MRRLAPVALLIVVTASLLRSQTSNPVSHNQAKAPQVSGLPPSAEQAMTSVDAQRIRAHVKFLASDLLEGRGTGQRGGDIAAEYMATQFALYGLKPAGDNGTYLQKVPFDGIATQDDSTLSLLPNGGAPLDLAYRKEYVATDETGNTRDDINSESFGWVTVSTRLSTTGTTTRASTSRARCCSCW